VEIIAHRGASHDAPENTLAAARLAWEQGADALECDVHLTRDGRLVVIHDDDTKRVSGTARVVAASTVAELQALDVGRWKDPQFATEKIPTLDEFLAPLPDGKRVFIELKNDAAAVAELTRCLARRALAPERVAVISFHLAAVRTAKRELPAAEVCWVRERDPIGRRAPLEEIIRSARDAGLDGLNLEAEWPVDAALVASVHAAGLKLYVWTVDDVILARKLVAAGVDGVTTNRPGWLRARL
jgi:glycerophosphoryl diester phosphodiesterase